MIQVTLQADTLEKLREQLLVMLKQIDAGIPHAEAPDEWEHA